MTNLSIHHRANRITRDPLTRRIVSRLRAGSLDARIRSGVPISSDQALACRAHRLTSEHMRHLVADGLERAVRRAGEPARAVISTRVPPERAAAGGAVLSLAALAARLRDDEDLVRPQGAALALHLLTDGSSPLHAPSEPGGLHAAALLALEACDTRVDAPA